MSVLTRSIHKITGLLNSCSKRFSSSLFENSYIKDDVARCPSSPADHSEKHIGMWYTIDPVRFSNLFGVDGLEPTYEDFPKVFNEFSLMIRKPALDVINILKNYNHVSHPLKFILYGRNGSGKTFTLFHLVDYLTKDYIVIHLAKLYDDLMKVEETVASKEPNMYDHTTVPARVLQHFKNQNKDLIEKLNLQTIGTYEWNIRETTPPGNLLELVDFGIQRSRYASQCLTVLFEELKRLSTEKKCKLAIVVDGINMLYTAETKKIDLAQFPVELDNFTYFRTIKNLLRPTWENGIIIGSVDMNTNPEEIRKSYTPRYLLTEVGWDAMDPFIPVKQEFYNDLEFRSALLYYNDRMWLQHPGSHTEQGYYEMEAITNRCPSELFKYLSNK